MAKKKAAKKKFTRTAPRKGGRSANKWSVVKWAEIEKFLEEKELTQARFSSTLGITGSTFHNWKKKRCAPDPATQQSIRDLIDGKEPLSPKVHVPALGRPKSTRGRASRTMAKVEQTGDVPGEAAPAPLAAAKAPRAARSTGKKRVAAAAPATNGNGANLSPNSGWEELPLLGQFIRANDGKSASELHQAVNMVLAVMV